MTEDSELGRLAATAIPIFEEMLGASLKVVELAEDREAAIVREAMSITDKFGTGIREVAPDMMLAVWTGVAAAIVYRSIAAKLLTGDHALGQRLMSKLFECIDASRKSQQVPEPASGAQIH